ncbi:MAG: SEL1-like repeat protein [Tepidamorphaceae bacterium]
MSAEHGNPMALNSLGWIYEQGDGVAQDYGASREWYLKAAEAGAPGNVQSRQG